jgi:RIO kinase 1
VSWDYSESLDSFFEQGLIDEVLYQVKSGKEATVFCCRAGSSTGEQLVAAKVYRPRERRGFKNDSLYREGTLVLDGRIRRAIGAKSAVGREAQFGMWVHHEYATLGALHAAGADVPRPIAAASSALLLAFLGDEEGPAPLLKHADIARETARPMFDRLIANVELWLRNNIVHGDLSPFNVLVWNGQATAIDFPQAVDPRFNPNAEALLRHDVEQICRFFTRFGVEANADDIATTLWLRFILSDFSPWDEGIENLGGAFDRQSIGARQAGALVRPNRRREQR